MLEQILSSPSAGVLQALTVGRREHERLEFLGDAILDMIVARVLFRARRDWSEAELTQAREAVVAGKVLARAAERRGLDSKLLGLREGKTATSSQMADVVEALIAAVTEERGMSAAEELIMDLLGSEMIAAASGRVHRHPKTELLERAQAAGWQPDYRVVHVEGEAHRPRYTVEVVVGPITAKGDGKSTRDAEASAALNALAQMGGRTALAAP